MIENSSSFGRRGFLKACAGASAALLHPASSFATTRETEKRLSLFNTHTNERLSVVYRTPSGYSPKALEAINHILRDHRTGDVKEMDPRLLDLLHSICSECGGDREFKIVSAYRSPRTNAMLRKRSRSVAKKSYHIKGMAADITMEGVRIRDLRRIALNLGRGGVGYYPRSGFVHVDTGPFRTW